MKDPFFGLDAIAQASLVSTGEVTPLDLVDAAIERINRINPKINALAHFDADGARKRASEPLVGPFSGVPTLIKDLLAWPGAPLEYGSRLFRGNVPTNISPYAKALSASGLVALGRSTTSELGLLGATETAANGATLNPWDRSRSSGGSSGGAVAAVAAGMVPVAHASDGGGSIRGPASLCGLFGFKPGRGRTLAADAPADSIMTAMLSDHCVSRSVRDSVAWLNVTQIPGSPAVSISEPLRQRLRIGFVVDTPFGTPPSEEARAALDATVMLCENLGHIVMEVKGPTYDAPSVRDAYFAAAGSGLSAVVDQIELHFGPEAIERGLEPFTRELVERARSGRLPVEAAPQTLLKAQQEIMNAMSGLDVMLSPTTPFPAWPLGTLDSTSSWSSIMAFTDALAGYTAPASIAGLPAMSVPLHWTPAGLPIGSHFMASQGDDQLLLRLAFQLEAAAPWHHRWPEIASSPWHND